MDLGDYLKVKSISQVKLYGPNFFLSSKALILTNHHLLFIAEGGDLCIPYKSIDAVRIMDNPNERRFSIGQPGQALLICTKTFCVYEITVPLLSDARALRMSIELLSDVDDLRLHYPFEYKASKESSAQASQLEDSKPFGDLETQFSDALATGRWRISQANANFAICESYPEATVVPADVSDQQLAEVALLRCRRRYPRLLYYHQPRKTALLIAGELLVGSPVGQSYSSTSLSTLGASSFFTSSMNAVGATAASAFWSNMSSDASLSMANTSSSINSALSHSQNHFRADEQLLAAVLPDRYHGMILDLRIYNNQSRRTSTQGGGVDSEPNYPQWRRVLRPMEPASKLNGTFRKFIEACTATTRTLHPSFLSTSPQYLSSINSIPPGVLTDSLSLVTPGSLLRPAETKREPSPYTPGEDCSPSTQSSSSLTADMSPFYLPDMETSVLRRTRNSSANGGSLVIADNFYSPVPQDNGASTGTATNNNNNNSGSFPSPTSLGNLVSVSGQAANPSLRQFATWLTLVREALAAAVAGATALDARDAFAQQQLQQDACLLARQQSGDRASAQLRGSFVLVQSKLAQDRALVVAGLIQVILNPLARTIHGFNALIEHTWIQSGFPFSERCRHSVFYVPQTQSAGQQQPPPQQQQPQQPSGSQVDCSAPVFLLFLDCVLQLWRQYPASFEFTDELLFLLAKHAYYSEFGTFLGNSMLERKLLELDTKTDSLWSYLEQPENHACYLNPVYSAEGNLSNISIAENYACWPSLAPQSLEVWQELYQRQLITDPDTLWGRPRRFSRFLVDGFEKERQQVEQLREILSSLHQEAVTTGLLSAV